MPSHNDHRNPVVAPVRHVPVCRLCGRELVADAAPRRSGRIVVNLACPRHGTLKRGERYLEGYLADTDGRTP